MALEGVEVVVDVDFVDFEAVDGLHLSRRGGALEPGRRAPAILVGHRHQAVFDRVLVDVVQPGQVRGLEGQLRIPVVEPDGAARHLVKLVDVGGRLSVQLRQPSAVDSDQRDRLRKESAAVGFGYLLDRRTVISFDAAGGGSHIATAPAEERRYTASVHAGIRRDLFGRLFASASFLTIWRTAHMDALLQSAPDPFSMLVAPLYSHGKHFSDFGLGWRFTPNLCLQYIYSTDYGFSPVSHAVMFRYTFRLRGE